MPASFLEAAADLDARSWTTFRWIVLPYSLPGVLTAIMVVFIPTVGNYVTPALVGGPQSVMIGSLIEMQFGRANDWPFGAALSVTVMLVIAGLIGLLRKTEAGKESKA
ncbi:MAG: ABC transporter permease subunit [Acetobacter aceti]|uniref:ABC transporter permease n=1 Tax=Acetobacter aceti TaxID=435 RepID=UPI001CA39E5B|nr:ABC transporter permease subunit [Acetobacter aceti]